MYILVHFSAVLSCRFLTR